jgi:hypothetical protein
MPQGEKTLMYGSLALKNKLGGNLGSMSFVAHEENWWGN